MEYLAAAVCYTAPVTVTAGFIVSAPYLLGAVGLSAAGPVAGGLFASMQGAGIVSGSIMATAQSVAMGGSIPAIYTATVAAASSGISYIVNCTM